MQVAVYHNQHGPAAVFTLPGKNSPEPPQHAVIPQGPFPRALSQFLDKGHALSWEQWADHLSGHLPYFDRWSVEQVPDGYTAQQALALVRSQAAAEAMPPAKSRTTGVTP